MKCFTVRSPVGRVSDNFCEVFTMKRGISRIGEKDKI